VFCLLILCLPLFPPAPVVPDGAGGYVPFTNSRVLPDGSLRPYDPALDGYPPPYSGPGQLEPQPGAWPEASEPRPGAPRSPPAHGRRHGAKKALHGCYDERGRPFEPVPPDCQTDNEGSRDLPPSPNLQRSNQGPRALDHERNV
jgi:hypothetical protein